MKLIALICPSCGAQLNVLPNKDKYYCSYCGNKIVPETQNIHIVGDVKIAGMATEESLLEKALILIKNGQFRQAGETIERVLDINPRNPKAYMRKLLCKKKCKDYQELIALEVPLDEEWEYKQALSFASGAYRVSILKTNSLIHQNIRKKEMEQQYRHYCDLMGTDTLINLSHAKQGFESLSGYKDASQLALRCENRIAFHKKNDELRLASIKRKETIKWILVLVIVGGLVILFLLKGIYGIWY